MALNHCFKIHGLILTITLSAVTGFVSPALGQELEETRSYLIDLNSREVTLLGTLGGGYSVANGINDRGQVVGYSETTNTGQLHAFITGSNGVGMTDLGTLGGGYSIANRINDAGQVVGEAATAAGAAHAFITGPNGVGMRDLGTLGGDYSRAYGINNGGQVVGESATSDGNPHAFITGFKGVGMTVLNSDFEGVTPVRATAINNVGQVVGTADTSLVDFAFITGPNGVGMSLLGPLGGDWIWAYDVNDIGQVVGLSEKTYCDEFVGECTYPHAFIAGNGMKTTDLGTLGGNQVWSYSIATDINDAGQVVGASTTVAEGLRAFITGPNGEGMRDLNSLVDMPSGGVLLQATAINNAGQVLAIGLIPEPETYALMLAGLILIRFVARQKSLPT